MSKIKTEIPSKSLAEIIAEQKEKKAVKRAAKVTQSKETLPAETFKVAESKLNINSDIKIDGNTFQSFNDDTFINFNNIIYIKLREYSQPSAGIYKFGYDLLSNCGLIISSPDFDTKKDLSNWLERFIR